MAIRLLLLALALSACAGSAPTDDGPAAVPTGDSDNAGTPEPEVLAYAEGLSISRVSVYQGVERRLFEADTAVTVGEDLVITNRDALVRVFVAPEPLSVARPTLARFTLFGSPESEVVVDSEPRTVELPSSDEVIESSFNFVVSGDDLRPRSEFRVELLEADPATKSSATEEGTTFDTERDLAQGLPTVRGEEMTLVILPFLYTYQGANRLPDLSEGHLGELRDRFLGMYPTANVTVEVGDSIEWPTVVRGNTDVGFSAMLSRLTDERRVADVSETTYFYGMINPAATFADFCPPGTPCIAGLSHFNFVDFGAEFRASVGLGFRENDLSIDTAAHEVGHAFGLEHAPCSVAGDPSYPYAGGKIGVWGFDIVAQELFSPDAFNDVMGYCASVWISDFHFDKLQERISEIGALQARVRPVEVTRLRIDGEDRVVERASSMLTKALPAELAIDVELLDEAGAVARVARGWRIPYSHAEGGHVLLDQQIPDGWTARLR